MPIRLTTPFEFNPGHGSASASCPEVMIVSFSMNTLDRVLTITMQYGDSSSGQWTGDRRTNHSIRLVNTAEEKALGVNPETGETEEAILVAADPQYDDMVDAFSNAVLAAYVDAGLGGYDAVGAFLYQFLLDAGTYVGAIE